MNKIVRVPNNEAEERLLKGGWQFAGLSLFSHPNLHGYYTFEQAEEFAFDMYCPLCNSCGVSGCCPPEKCVKHLCLHGDDYKLEIKELEVDFDDLWFNASMLWQTLKCIEQDGLTAEMASLIKVGIESHTNEDGEFDGLPHKDKLKEIRDKYCRQNYSPKCKK